MTATDTGGLKAFRWRLNPTYCQRCRHRTWDHEERRLGVDSWGDPVVTFGHCRRLVQEAGHPVTRCGCQGGHVRIPA